MMCPVCNAPNGAMSARCLECGTILIPEAVGRSAALQGTVNRLDKKMLMGYGGLLGFAIGMAAWFILSQDESSVQIWLMASTAVGTALGRLLAWRKRNHL